MSSNILKFLFSFGQHILVLCVRESVCFVSFVHEHVLCMYMYCIYTEYMFMTVWPELSPIKFSSVLFCS